MLHLPAELQRGGGVSGGGGGARQASLPARSLARVCVCKVQQQPANFMR